jgi:phenylalanyl-tRNA synthetase beta chain
MNAVNNIVDITNYVLLEVGQPLHAFDYNKISQDICVRKASGKEEIVALDKKIYNLTDNDLVISDNNGAIAIAGVMGGMQSSVESSTSEILLEAARFEKSSIRFTARRLNLRSDSSKRYERGVDNYCVETGRKRALHLIQKLGIGIVTDLFCFDKSEKSFEKKIEMK